MKIVILNTTNGFKAVGNHAEEIDLQYPEKFGFEGQERLASSRGYIWSRSIPMLKKTILLGHGPDTFAIYFPQNDFVGKLNAFGNTSTLVDKPHNLYLQIGINTGVISLLAFLALIFIYVARCIKLYIKDDIASFEQIIGVGVMAGIIGYCVAGFFNDSVVSVAPVFWILLGLGFACNNLVKKYKEEVEKGETKQKAKATVIG